MIPTSAFELEALGAFVLVGFDRVESHAAQDRKVGRGVIFARSGLVFMHDYVEHPR
jgi:hypothetical protein